MRKPLFYKLFQTAFVFMALSVLGLCMTDTAKPAAGQEPQLLLFGLCGIAAVACAFASAIIYIWFTEYDEYEKEQS